MTSHIPPAANGSYPLRQDNHVCPLIDSANAFDRICGAVEAATQSVWVTVAFLNQQFEMPNGRGSVFDVCEKAARRGLDVRFIFWRSARFNQLEPGTHFHGLDEQAALLVDGDYQFLARWDTLPGDRCHHQKSWLVDAGTPREVAFVGGANPGAYGVAERGHPEHREGSSHDLYCELRGPAVTDVHHNFVQRWNEASEKDRPGGAWPSLKVADDLPFPDVLSPKAGEARVQIARTVRKGQYSNPHPAVAASSFPVEGGEKSILAQYLGAIGSAQTSIYIEDQYIGSVEVLEALEAALKRGVDVVYLLPGTVNGNFSAARKSAPSAPLFQVLDKLAAFQAFTLAALCSSPPDGSYCEIHIHSKIAIVDDHWVTIGSCNLSDRSLHSHTEMNATIWDESVARKLHADLLQEHLNIETGGKFQHDAQKHFHEIARANTKRRTEGTGLQGLAYAIDPRTYGL